MNIVPTQIPEVVVLEPQIFRDSRGFFFESYSDRHFHRQVAVRQFVQDNHSYSQQHVVRGLHYQIHHPQGKLVRVLAGAIFDVAVDLRRTSPTFGQWVGEILSGENKRQLWVPEGFAHGFLVLSAGAEVLYKVTHFHAPEHERCLYWNDPTLAIAWPLAPGETPLLSPRDQAGLPWGQIEVYGS